MDQGLVAEPDLSNPVQPKLTGVHGGIPEDRPPA